MPFFVTEHQLLFQKNWTVVIDARLDCAFVKNALVLFAPNIGGGRAPLVPPLLPPDMALCAKGADLEFHLA